MVTKQEAPEKTKVRNYILTLIIFIIAGTMFSQAFNNYNLQKESSSDFEDCFEGKPDSSYEDYKNGDEFRKYTAIIDIMVERDSVRSCLAHDLMRSYNYSSKIRTYFLFGLVFAILGILSLRFEMLNEKKK